MLTTPCQAAPSGRDRAASLSSEGAIRACKVMAVCPKCNKPTRPAHKFLEDGTKSSRLQAVRRRHTK